MVGKLVELNSERNYYLDILLGISIGDALGLPFEFIKRNSIEICSNNEMIGFGTYNKPPGTFSDDSSLTFCTIEALISGYSKERLISFFLDWYLIDFWTADGELFDIGATTQLALENYSNNVPFDLAVDNSENSNGNGSLMRILPFVFYVKEKNIDERFEFIKEVSSITHGHIRCAMACFYYIEFALLIMEYDKIQKKNLNQKIELLQIGCTKINSFFNSRVIENKELIHFKKFLDIEAFEKLDVEEIKSEGYVVFSLEACLYCFLKTDTFEDCLIAAIKLGGDTDTIASLAGGLSALYYGHFSIPEKWLDKLKRKNDIIDLAFRWKNSKEKRYLNK